MLVLSRREAEKVLFPTLGITVEVTRVQGKTVRLGIDAPDEIRIVRGELDQFETSTYGNETGYTTNGTTASAESFDGNRSQVQQCLDAANLAIHLAMNQLKQQLNGNAETAMENALQCLEELELAVNGQSQIETRTASVREAGTKYRVSAKPVSPTAAIIASDPPMRDRLTKLLTEKGFQVVEFAEEASLLKYLQSYEQPTVVLAAEPTGARSSTLADSLNEVDPEFELKISGVDGLRRNRILFSIDNLFNNDDSNSTSPQTQLTGWFDNSEIAVEFESMLQSA